MLKRVLSALASRRFATALILSWMGLVVVWVVPFEFYGLPNAQIQRIIYHESFFMVVYVLFGVSTLACMVPRFLLVLRRARKVPGPTAHPAAPADGASFEGRLDPELADRVLRSQGYSRTARGVDWCWGVSNRWAPLFSVVFHLSIVAFMVAITVFNDPSATFVGKAAVAEGETFTGQAAEYASVESSGAGFPSNEVTGFSVKSIRPRFHRNILLFTDLRAVLDTPAFGEKTVTLSAPLITSATDMIAIEDFGYAVRADAGSRETSASGGVYKLKVFPSGVADTFDTDVIGQDTYRVTVTVYGDYVSRHGIPGSKSFNLNNPRLKVSVARLLSTGTQKMLVRDRIISVGDAIQAGDARIEFQELRSYGVFRLSHSAGAPWACAGLALMVVALAVRYLMPRREAVVQSSNGHCVVSVRDDVFGTWPRGASRLVAALEEAKAR